jgi:MFS-type transporter involved in bile tolerance (Atg22 family)
VLGIWWFVWQQYRPGPRLPKWSSYVTIGWKQVSIALVEIRQLPRIFFLHGLCLLTINGIATTSKVVDILQAQIMEHSFLKLTYIGTVTSICSMISTFGFWYFQKHFNTTTKRMYLVTYALSVLLPLYGIAGISRNIGYKREVGFWLFGAVCGLFQPLYYAYTQTLLSELTRKVSLGSSKSNTLSHQHRLFVNDV